MNMDIEEKIKKREAVKAYIENMRNDNAIESLNPNESDNSEKTILFYKELTMFPENLGPCLVSYNKLKENID